MLQTGWKDAVITITDDAVLSAEVDLGMVCDGLLIIIPELDDTTQVSIQVSDVSGGTFQDLYITDPADGGDNILISAVSTGETTWILPFGGFQFIKIKVDNDQEADRTFKVCGTRS